MNSLSHSPRPSRYAMMDGLRGFALFGILLVNLQSMSEPAFATGVYTLWDGAFDQVVRGLVAFFGDSSFYVLFSMLFGAGFHFMMTKRARAGRPFAASYLRRLALLGLFGMLHIGLLWFGDILLVYAVLGCGLILFRERADKTLLIWAGVLAIIPFLYMGAVIGLAQLAISSGGIDAAQWEWEIDQWFQIRIGLLLEGYRQTSFLGVAQTRWYEYGEVIENILVMLPLVAAAMLGGMWLARKGVLSRPEQHQRFFKRLLWVCLPIAVLGKGLYVLSLNHLGGIPDGYYLICWIGIIVGGPALSLVYLALWQRWYASDAVGRLQVAFARAGRLSLTHYLSHSIIASLVFYGFGLRLYGSVPPALQIVFALAIFSAQLVISYFWLNTFRYGPLETVLRKFTYLKRKH